MILSFLYFKSNISNHLHNKIIIAKSPQFISIGQENMIEINVYSKRILVEDSNKRRMLII